ncbi:MAG TPA: hypothetical protein VK202_09605, partial [Bacteroidia bacterium]|nr:hypothetical protein [Bacteroidia bacterium]
HIYMKELNAEDTLRALSIEQEIKNLLGQDSNHQVNFNYSERNGNIQLFIETINPRYNQMFLFHAEVGIDKLDVLNKSLAYARGYRDHFDSYTIQWSATGEQGVRTSYFHGRSIEEALEKFRYGRDRNKTTIFLVSLNPKA